ncbi:MAG: hypothetical protein ACRC8A_08810 [Microcoleaceae cyanobacterium]
MINLSCAVRSPRSQPKVLQNLESNQNLLLQNPPQDLKMLSQDLGHSRSSLSKSILEPRLNSPEEIAFQTRSLAIRKKLAAEDLIKADAWWRRVSLGDPHKYLLPIILARLSLHHRPDQTWEILLKLDRDKQDLYHFRSPLDVRIFFLFQDTMPNSVKDIYRNQLALPQVLEWTEGGTENHMFMHRASGLALMDGSGFPVGDPASAATNEAWLRAELNKFLTIGQGEFHSSIYYGYSISGLLNLYDFAQNPELKKLAKGLLDWLATNMALRLSWGTAGGAESRGFDRKTWDSGLTAVAWQWWGEDTELVNKMGKKQAWLALPAGLSSYRPPEILRDIADKHIPLPFEAQISHPAYYSYDADNQLWETFYVAADYSLGTLLEPNRSYQVQGTIRAQYATYKLVVRDPRGIENSVVNLGGTYHTHLATGRSPADQLVQKRGTVLFQSILNAQDLAAGVPPRTSLVMPQGYGNPQRHKEWYVWQIKNIWLCARVWGDRVAWKPLPNQNQPVVTAEDLKFEGLVAEGIKTAWITDVASMANYPNFQQLTQALDQAKVDDSQWSSQGKLTYQSLAGDLISLTYNPQSAIGVATINHQPRVLKSWSVIESPYIQEMLNSGVLSINLKSNHPKPEKWQLRGTLTGPEWIIEN